MRFGWPEIWVVLGIGTMTLAAVYPTGNAQLEFLIGFVALMRGDVLDLRREIDGWERV